jgi:hypothetical protein
VYTQWHHRRKSTDGPLFRGRYKAIVIDAGQYLLQVSRYIHRNPIELKKPLVQDLEDYPWSSYAAYLNKGKVDDWLNHDTVYGDLGSRQNYRAYKRYVEQGNDSETLCFYQRKHTRVILGDNSFKEYARSRARSLESEIDKQGLREPTEMLAIISAVADCYGVSKKDLCVAEKAAKRVPEDGGDGPGTGGGARSGLRLRRPLYSHSPIRRVDTAA